MRKLYKAGVTVGLVSILASCASTTVLPTGGNTYTSVTTSSDQGYAQSDAKSTAEKQCTKMGRRLAVVNQQVTYRGADTSSKIVGGIVGGLLGIGNPAVSNNDYEIKMKFRCA